MGKHETVLEIEVDWRKHALYKSSTLPAIWHIGIYGPVLPDIPLVREAV